MLWHVNNVNVLLFRFPINDCGGEALKYTIYKVYIIVSMRSNVDSKTYDEMQYLHIRDMIQKKY